MPTDNINLGADVSNLIAAMDRTAKSFEESTKAAQEFGKAFAALNKSSEESVKQLVSSADKLTKVTKTIQQIKKEVSGISSTKFEFDLNTNAIDFFERRLNELFKPDQIGKNLKAFRNSLILGLEGTFKDLNKIISDVIPLALKGSLENIKTPRQLRIALKAVLEQKDIEAVKAQIESSLRLREAITIRFASNLNELLPKDQARITQFSQKAAAAFAETRIPLQRALELLDQVVNKSQNINIRPGTGEQQLLNRLIQIAGAAEKAKQNIDKQNASSERLQQIQNRFGEALNFTKDLVRELGNLKPDSANRVQNAVDQLAATVARANVPVDRLKDLFSELRANGVAIPISVEEKGVTNALNSFKRRIETIQKSGEGLQKQLADEQQKQQILLNIERVREQVQQAIVGDINRFSPEGINKVNVAIDKLVGNLAKGKVPLQQIIDLLERFKSEGTFTPRTQGEVQFLSNLENVRRGVKLAVDDIEKLRLGTAKPIALDRLIRGGINVPANLAREVQPFVDRLNNLLQKGLATNQLDAVIKKVREGGITAFTGLESQAASAVRGIIGQVNQLPGPFGFVEQVAKRFGQTLINLTLIDFARSTVFGFVERVKQSVQEAINFGIRVAEVQTIAARGSQSISEQFIFFSTKITELASKFGQPLQDVTLGLYQTFSNQVAQGTENILVLESALRLAQATVSTTAQAVDLLTGALNSFGLSAFHADRVAALFFKTVDLGRVTIGEISSSFGRVGPLARVLGVSLEESLAALSSLTIRGINSSEAITLLTNVMLQLTKPSEAMKDLFNEIGVASGQAAIGAFGFTGFLRLMQNELVKGNTRIAELFPELRAMKGVFSLAAEGADDFNEILGKVGNSTTQYTDALKIIQNNTSKQLQVELNKVSTFITTEFGTNLVNAILAVVKALGTEEDGIVGGLRRIIATVKIAGLAFVSYQVTVRGLTAASAAYVAISSLFSRVTTVNTAAIQAQTVATQQATVATSAFGLSLATLQSFTGLGILAAGLTAVVVAMNQAEESLTEKLTKLQQKFDKLTQDRIENTRKAIAEEEAEFNRSLQRRTRDFLSHTVETNRLLKQSADTNKKVMDELGLSIKASLTKITDGMKQNISELENVASKARDFILETDKLVSNLPAQLNEDLLDSQLRTLEQRQTILDRQAGDDFSRQNNRVNSLAHSVELLEQAIDDLRKSRLEAVASQDSELFQRLSNQIAQRAKQAADLRRELITIGGNLPGLPVFPQTLRVTPQGKLEDISKQALTNLENGLKVQERFSVQGKDINDIEAAKRDLYKEQLNLQQQMSQLRAQDEAFAEQEAKALREREKLVASALTQLVEFKVTKDGKARTKEDIDTELKALETQVRSNLPDGQNLADLIEFERLVTATKRQAAVERIRIATQEAQNETELIKKQLKEREKAALDTKSRSIAEGKELLTKLAGDTEILLDQTKKINETSDAQVRRIQILGADVKNQLAAAARSVASGEILDTHQLDTIISKLKILELSIKTLEGRNIVSGGIGIKGLTDTATFDPGKVIPDLQLSLNEIFSRIDKAGAELRNLGTQRTQAEEELLKTKTALDETRAAVNNLNDPLKQLSTSFALLGQSLQGNPLTNVISSLSPDKLSPSIQSTKELQKTLSDLADTLNRLREESIKLGFGQPGGNPNIPGFAHGGIVGTDNRIAKVSPGETIVDAINSRKFATQLFSIRSGHAPVTNTTSDNSIQNVTLNIHTTETVDGPRILNFLRRERRRGNI